MMPALASDFPALLEPLVVGPMVIPNRIMMAPMERNYGLRNGEISSRTLAHYAERAANGVGWVDVEATFVAEEGRGRVHQLGLHTDAMVNSFSRLVESCHDHGCVVSVELHHAGRHASRQITGLTPVAPSPVDSPESDGEACRELDLDDVSRVVNAYANAATRAIDAGVDGVELHGAHGYLVHQFLSPLTNRRRDAYGGTARKRQEFAVRTVAALRRAVGDQPVAVGCRLSVTEGVEDGFTEDFVAELGVRLVAEGVDYISLNAGSIDAPLMISPPMGFGVPGWLAPISKRLRAAWGIPVVVAGRFLDLASGERAVSDGAADVIAFGRALLADPEMVSKTLSGRLSEVTPCTSCNQGCVARIGQQLDATCTVNPRMGREVHEWSTVTQPPRRTGERMVVIGGGPAGMLTALGSAARGFDVHLFEARAVLGGSLRHAAAHPARDGWASYLAHLETRLGHSRVSVHLNESLTADLGDLAGEVLVVATGSAAVTTGLTRQQTATPRVLGSTEALDNIRAVGDKCVVVGGDVTAVGTALSLVHAGVRVAAVIGPPPSDRSLGGLEWAVATLVDAGCEFLPDKTVTAMGEGTVRLADLEAIGNIREESIGGVDSVVVCWPRVPVDPVGSQAGTRFSAVHRVGEAALPGDLRAAVADAHALVYSLAR